MRFLRRRIESVLCQTYQDFELILLDDCSSDESRSLLSEYAGDPRVRIEFNEVNSGSPFKQWNKGVRLARGQYVWIAESDDYADKRLLERLVAQLFRSQELYSPIADCLESKTCENREN
jgi:glycosyltransferase involved in cell wall biosynthesis